MGFLSPTTWELGSHSDHMSRWKMFAINERPKWPQSLHSFRSQCEEASMDWASLALGAGGWGVRRQTCPSLALHRQTPSPPWKMTFT